MAVRGRKLSPAIRILSGILIFLSVLCLLTLALHLMGMPGPGAAPGRLLMELFSWAAFFIPLYFIFALILLVAPVFRRRSALMLMLSIFPFLTASLLLLVVGGSALSVPDLLLSSFGMIPSAILLSLLLAMEIIFLFTLPFGLTTAIEGARSAPLDKRKKMKLLPPVGDPALHKVVEPPGEDPPIEVEAEVVEPEPLHRQVPRRNRHPSAPSDKSRRSSSRSPPNNRLSAANPPNRRRVPGSFPPPCRLSPSCPSARKRAESRHTGSPRTRC